MKKPWGEGWEKPYVEPFEPTPIGYAPDDTPVYGTVDWLRMRVRDTEGHEPERAQFEAELKAAELAASEATPNLDIVAYDPNDREFSYREQLANAEFLTRGWAENAIARLALASYDAATSEGARKAGEARGALRRDETDERLAEIRRLVELEPETGRASVFPTWVTGRFERYRTSYAAALDRRGPASAHADVEKLAWYSHWRGK